MAELMPNISPPSRTKIFLDIETVAGDITQIPTDVGANLGNMVDIVKIEEKIAKERQKWVDRAALNWPTGQVICVGLKKEGESVTTIMSDDEQQLLTDLLNYLHPPTTSLQGMSANQVTELYSPAQLVTFNGQEFDIPYLLGRCWHHGIKIPALIDAGFQRPWETDRHLDLMYFLNKGGRFSLWKGGTTLAAWCNRAGIGVEDETTGQNIPELWERVENGEANNVEPRENLFLAFSKIVTAHCRADVLKTEALYHSIKDYLLPPEKHRHHKMIWD